MTVEPENQPHNGRPVESNSGKKMTPRELYTKMSNDGDYTGILASPDLESIPGPERRVRAEEILARQLKEIKTSILTLEGMGFKPKILDIDLPKYHILKSEFDRLYKDYQDLIAHDYPNWGSQ